MTTRFRTTVLMTALWMTAQMMQPYFSMAFASDFRYDTKGKRDPFLSPAQAALLKKQLGPGELRLEGIIIDAGAASYVVVNREVVKAGDSFSGFMLKKIEPNAATFVKDGEEFTLFLREDEKKLGNQNAHALTPKKE